MSTLALHFGALAQPIKRQLIEQGFAPNVDDCARWQKLADSITMLTVHSFLGERATEQMRKRLLKRISKELT